MNLVQCLSNITDPRRKQGMRHNLHQMFSMLILGGLCGHFGGRAVARFSQANAELLTKHLGLIHPPPSHVSFSAFLNSILHQELINAFHTWTSNYVPLSKNEQLSGDGKSLKSTATDNQGKTFQAVVTIFAQDSGLAHRIATYRNEKKSEIHVMQNMLQALQSMGLTIFLDSLHCQKKQSKRFDQVGTIMLFK